MWLEELKQAANINILSCTQVQIIEERSIGFTYEDIRKIHNLSCDAALVTCLVRTSQCKFWEPGYPGGNDTYLSLLDAIKFKSLIIEAANDANCVPTTIAISIAYSLRKERIQKAISILQDIRCNGLISHLDDLCYPSDSWLYHIKQDNGFKIVTPQELDIARRLYCDTIAIHNFFSAFESLLQLKDPRLLLNMDETMCNTKKKLKIIVPQNIKNPLIIKPAQIPHITGVLTVTAFGQYLKPMVILSNKKTLRNLENLESRVFLCSTTSGWMNAECFFIYSIHLIREISLYRISLPSNIRDESILLILDGHISRCNFYALLLLHLSLLHHYESCSLKLLLMLYIKAVLLRTSYPDFVKQVYFHWISKNLWKVHML